VAELVVLEVVGSEPEAELICSLLRSEGIPCIQQKTNYAAGVGDGMSVIGGPREIVVHEENLAAAREVLQQQRPLGTDDIE
jgi:Putative prokaryotic signal transducing protein